MLDLICNLDCWDCNLIEFMINGIQGQVEDFGETYDHGPSNEDKDESCCWGGCYNMQFDAQLVKAVLQKYGIITEEYHKVCKKLEQEYSFGHCDLCN